MIVERLNTGGVNLQPQEIRVTLYHGDLVRVLRTLNEEAEWRSLFGRKSKRLKDMEMVLRFFAFYYHADAYRSPMKDFLNRYMASNQTLARQNERELQTVFVNTTSIIATAIGARAFRPVRSVNAAVIDSVMTGVARRLAKGPIKKRDSLESSNYLAALIPIGDKTWKSLLLMNTRTPLMAFLICGIQSHTDGRLAGTTFIRVQNYYARIKDVVDHIADLCVPTAP